MSDDSGALVSVGVGVALVGLIFVALGETRALAVVGFGVIWVIGGILLNG